MLMHHIFATVALLLAMISGYGNATIGACAILFEVSSVPLNIRSYYKKEEFGQPFPLFLQISFFILYTIFRIIFSPFVAYFAVHDGVIVWNHIGYIRRICLVLSLINFILLAGLSYIWYVKGLTSMARGMGLIEKVKTKLDKLKQIRNQPTTPKDKKYLKMG